MSEKYRDYFKENIPEHLEEEGSENALYTSNGSLVCSGYDRIVIGDYGAFVEFSPEQAASNFSIKKGQEYRVNDERYKNNVKYIWLSIDDGSDVKIYLQKRTVSYADYLPERYYVSVHEVYA